MSAVPHPFGERPTDCRAHIAAAICLVDPDGDGTKFPDNDTLRPCLDGGQQYVAAFEQLYDAFAQNLVRYTAYIENPTRPHFAKVLRFKVLMLPVQVVRHARSVTFRFMEHHEREVKNWLSKIKSQFGFDFADNATAPPFIENFFY